MSDIAHASGTGARARLRPIVYPVLLLLAACGGGGGGYGGGGGGGGMAPTVTLTESASSITLGQSATLTWSSTGATTCNESGAWSMANAGTSGSTPVTPAAAGSDTYTMTCTGTYGSGSKSVTLTVTAAGAGPYSMTSLVADTKGTAAQTTDANLVNPWGLSMAPGAPVWTSNNATQTSTLYDGNGKAQPFGSPLIVKLEAGFAPTGIVANSSGGFRVTSGAKSAPSQFIYAGTSGKLAGWAETVDLLNAITAFTDAGGATYTGLAIANKSGVPFLYAADFHNNKIDVFNSSWVKQASSSSSFSFTDSTLPKGYAPFGIQAIDNGTGGATQIYVAYAMQTAPANVVSMAGAGLGLVDVYDTNGALLMHLIPAGGKLNAPWGIALAPKDYGALSNDLLVGNFGDGTINAYDAAGKWVAAVSDSKNNPVKIPGLWGIVFGNDFGGQPHNTLFFAAGPNDGANGVYGRLDAGSTPPALNKAPVVKITAPPPSTSGGGYGGGGGSTLKGIVAVTATATSSLGITSVSFFENGNLLPGSPVMSPPYTVQWDTTKDANGTISLTAKATDADGNVGTSPAVSVDVSNAAGGGAVTLTKLYSTYFGPICSHCHTGVGSSLPGVQNFSSKSATYSALVNVASIEEPSIMRVKPNDPTNSYLIQKLQGTAASGARMPFGGPYLSAAQINDFISWINSGAPNN
jgi:uncharacterized protein (TIGR03118 family)